MATESEQLDGLRFDAFAATYDGDTIEMRCAARREVTRRARQAGGGVILDIGCGTGAALLECAPDFTHAIGLDVSERMLDAARQKATDINQTNVTFRHAGFTDLSDPALIDELRAIAGPIGVVMSNYAMHHLDRDDKINSLHAMAALLEPGGMLLLGDLIEFDPGTIEAGADPDHVGFDPAWDKPEPVGILTDALEQCHMTVRSQRMHALVGVLEGVKHTGAA